MYRNIVHVIADQNKSGAKCYSRKRESDLSGADGVGGDGADLRSLRCSFLGTRRLASLPASCCSALSFVVRSSVTAHDDYGQDSFQRLRDYTTPVVESGRSGERRTI